MAQTVKKTSERPAQVMVVQSGNEIAATAAKQIPAAPCSPSPGIIRMVCSPSAFIASRVSATSVEGVMG
jgi:hypothetical protein